MVKKAAAIVLTFFVVIILTILSGPIFSNTLSENNLAKRHLQNAQSFWLAEAGAQRGLWELNNGDGTWTGWTDVSGTKIKTETLGAIGDYTVEIADPGGSPIVTATGHVPDVSSSSRVERAVEVVAGGGSVTPFSYAAFGGTALVMSGNGHTDSYDSSLGPYGGANVGGNGDVGTNGGVAGAISLSGNATVNGDAATGEGGTVNISGNAKVNGVTTDGCDEQFPSITVPASLTSLSSLGNYSLGGNNNATLTGSDYKYISLSVSGNADLTISGTVNIYLTSTANALSTSGNGKIIITSGAKLNIYSDGLCSISGNGIANQTSIPENLVINSTYGGNNGITISGNGDMYGAIYAPGTKVTVSGNGDIYGSVVADSVSITGNGDVHYDESLADVSPSGGGGSPYTVQSWAETKNPYILIP
ncbi:MAG: hypothetical protein ABH858_01025 [Candidatus Omnitrophota bacterium]